MVRSRNSKSMNSKDKSRPYLLQLT